MRAVQVTDAALGHSIARLSCFVHEIDLREIFECAHLKFTVYGCKQASTYVNTLPQCSPASVALAQARPNYKSKVTTPQDAHGRLVLQIYLGSNSLEFSATPR